MRLAVVDLGTNSVRFAIHEIRKDGVVRQLHREKLMVRLGEDVFLRGRLSPEAASRTMRALERFRRDAHALKADRFVAYATSALREAKDRDSFIERVRRRTGIEVRVISGVEEAQLIALGVLHKESPSKIGKKSSRKPFALVDIGGGSTEISICRGREILHSHSFPLGTARLQQLFLKSCPPSESSMAELRQYVRGVMMPKLEQEKWPKVERVIGSSGTIRALGKICGTKGKTGSQLKDLRRNVTSMARLRRDALLKLKGMEPRRADMILGGGLLFEEILGLLGAKRFVTTEYSLRDGMLIEEVQLARKHQRSHLTLHLPELFAKAARFGADPGHLNRMCEMAESLFEKLQPVHKLPEQWLLYLKAATVLRNAGRAISEVESQQHAYYIIRHADLPGTESWELEFVAQLCLRMRQEKFVKEQIPFSSDRRRYAIFMKVLALLQLVDALDPGPETKARAPKVKFDRRRVQLFVERKSSSGLEPIQVQLRARFLEKVLGKGMVAEVR